MNEITLQNMIQKVRKRIHVIELFMNVRLYFILYKRFYERYTYRGIDDTDPNITEFNFRTGYYQSRNALAIREITKRENEKVCKICYLSVQNPTKTFLRELYNIIKSEIESDSKLSKLYKRYPQNTCCIHCAESALDFFPNDVKNLEYIFDYLISGMFIRYGQEDEHQLHKKMTFYYGKEKEFVDSNTGKKRRRVYVHNHLHGVRVYHRPKKGKYKYIRFEFLANKDRLIRMKLRDLKSLPKISTESIRPMDHVVYRKKNEQIPSEYFK